MKIAICLFGLPRCMEMGRSIMKSFYAGFDIDYYIHAWGDNQTYENIKTLYNPVQLKVDAAKDFSTYLSVEPDTSKNNRSISDAISPLCSINEVGKLIAISKDVYDFVAITRHDIVNISNIPLIKNVTPGKIYTSYVNGPTWVLQRNNLQHDNHIDAKFLCGSKEDMLYFSTLYDRLDSYIAVDKKPLCHHRLFFHHLNPVPRPIEMLKMDQADVLGGWRFLRNNIITNH